MKFLLHIALFGCFLTLLTACSSTNVITLEMRKPAEVTIPSKIEKVIVLNNTVIQPLETLDRTPIQKSAREDLKINVDTISWLAVGALTSALLGCDSFDEVDIYSKPIRKGGNFLTQVKLDEQVLYDFLTDLDYDMIISVDRIICTMEQQVDHLTKKEKLYRDEMIFNHFYGLLSCGVYVKDRLTPLTTFDVNDSTYFFSHNNGDSIRLFRSWPESYLGYLAEKMARTAANKFISTWERSDRKVFTSSAARMKEAYTYANFGNWSQAKELWINLFNQKNKPKDKAKLSSNVAVTCEMLGDFQEALEWAQKSKSYFTETGKKADKDNLEWINSYIVILEKRITDNKLLDEQWGVKQE